MFLLVSAFFTLHMRREKGEGGGWEGAAEVVVAVATTKVAEEAMEIEEIAVVS